MLMMQNNGSTNTCVLKRGLLRWFKPPIAFNPPMLHHYSIMGTSVASAHRVPHRVSWESMYRPRHEHQIAWVVCYVHLHSLCRYSLYIFCVQVAQSAQACTYSLYILCASGSIGSSIGTRIVWGQQFRRLLLTYLSWIVSLESRFKCVSICSPYDSRVFCSLTACGHDLQAAPGRRKPNSI